MNAEFNWWLLIVGVVGGAGLLWLVLGDWSRREEEVGAVERAREAEWIAEVLRADGAPVDPATTEEILRLHRTWLRETGGFDPLEDEVVAAASETVAVPVAPVAPVAVAPVALPIGVGAEDPQWKREPDRPEAVDDLRALAGRAIRREPLPEE